jgi:hypothetical protein
MRGFVQGWCGGMSRSVLKGEQCSARAKSTGHRCQRLVVGAPVCVMHGGGAPQVRRARERRIALAEALLADPRRGPDEVLADVLHQSDFLMREARSEIQAGRVTTATMTRLVELAERAGTWARHVLDSGVQERQVRLAEGQGAMVAAVLSAIFDDLVLDERQRRLVPTVVPRHLRALTDGKS